MPKTRPQVEQRKEFGANVRRVRTALRMTQEQLAELTELNIRNVQRIEAGEINILVSTAARLRRALKCRWEDLMPFDW